MAEEKIKILVVDDDLAVCQFLCDFLQQKGYEPVRAFSGEEALRKLKPENPRLVLLDYSMPGLTGLETLTHIRAKDPKIGVIMVTAVQDEAVWKQAQALGAYAYVLKPVDFKYLEMLITTKLMLMESA